MVDTELENWMDSEISEGVFEGDVLRILEWWDGAGVW